VTEQGNFVDHSDPNPLPNQNVLSVADTNITTADVPLLKAAKERIFKARSQRVRPHLDDKVLASWNGLMVGALARAGVVLKDDTFLKAATKNLEFLHAKLWDSKTQTLYHRWRDGERDSVQLLEAYAFLLAGVIEVYQCTLEPRHLEFAVALADSMLKRFYDPEHGGFWQSPPGTGDLILRVKEDYDGAEPSGNSVATLSLLKLFALTERKEYRDAADKSLRLFSDRLQRIPQAVGYMLVALDFAVEDPKRAVIATDDIKSPEARALVQSAHAVFQARKVVLATSGPVESFARTLKPKEGRATVYVCTGTACQPPTNDSAKLRELLR
jgi:uncharacterized protein YyaL (SSP411 family)